MIRRQTIRPVQRSKEMFERKAMKFLEEWKQNWSPNYAALLEGARRVGKSTLAEKFARDNYRSYIKKSVF